MNKGAIVVGGGLLAVLGLVALAASADEPKGGRRGPLSQRRGSRKPTEGEEEEYGERWSEECNAWDSAIMVLEKQRDSAYNAMQAAADAGDEEALKGWASAFNSFQQQIAALDAKIDAECVG